MQLDFNQLRELIAALEGTDISEFTLKKEDLELTIRKGFGGGVSRTGSDDCSPDGGGP